MFTTERCHALWEYTRQSFGSDKATELMMVMFHAYFELASDVRQPAVMQELYARVGLDWTSRAATAANELLSPAAPRKRTSKVPHLIVESSDGSAPLTFTGAQPADVLAMALEEQES